ncbi:MAG TPA: glutathione S-transferase family protein [Roseiarcus sp.]|nr:glutathione S-transferase family protein [Roseiarcus sp.]
MKLYFSRNYNPRLAVAAARFLKSPVRFEFAAPFAPGQEDKFLKLNPNQTVPILVEGDKAIWEADAIACRLSQLAKSDFWPMGDSLPDIVRHCNFVRACDLIHFERVTRQRYGLGPVRREFVDMGLSKFATSAAILERHLSAADRLIGSEVTYADFRIACVLPFADLAGLPLGDFPHVEAETIRRPRSETWRIPT